MTNNNEIFYYAFNEKVSLVPKTNALLVKYADGTEKTDAEKLVRRFSEDLKINWYNSSSAKIITKSQKEKEELILKLKQNNSVKTCLPFYTLENGLEMGVTDEFLIRFLPEVTEVQKQELLRKFNPKLIKATEIYQKFEVRKGEDALTIANRFYESGLVEF